MSRHPSEPPADWLPSPDEGTARPAPGDALPRRPVPPQPPAGQPGWFQAPDGQHGDGDGPGDHQNLSGNPATPGYPPMPDYPRTPDYPPAPGYPEAAGYPYPPPHGAHAAPGPGYPGYPDHPYPDHPYPAPPGQPAASGQAQHPPNGHQPPVSALADPATGAGPAIAHDGYVPDYEGYGLVPADGGVDRHGPVPDEYGVVYDDYGQALEDASTARPVARDLPEPVGTGPDPAAALLSDGSAARWAMLCYLTVPVFGFVIPLLVYLRALRGPRWTRAHAAQALNVWITVLLYALSALIMGTMLALDSPQIALIVFAPLVAGLWLAMLILLVRAATAASQGEEYTFPRWLCSRIVR